MLLFTVLTGSSGFSMTAGLLIMVGLLVPVYSLLNRLIRTLLPAPEFDISLYTLDGNIAAAGLGAAPQLLLRCAGVGCFFILVSVLISMLIMQKRDVR